MEKDIRSQGNSGARSPSTSSGLNWELGASDNKAIGYRFSAFGKNEDLSNRAEDNVEIDKDDGVEDPGLREFLKFSGKLGLLVLGVNGLAEVGEKLFNRKIPAEELVEELARHGYGSMEEAKDMVAGSLTGFDKLPDWMERMTILVHGLRVGKEQKTGRVRVDVDDGIRGLLAYPTIPERALPEKKVVPEVYRIKDVDDIYMDYYSKYISGVKLDELPAGLQRLALKIGFSRNEEIWMTLFDRIQVSNDLGILMVSGFPVSARIGIDHYKSVDIYPKRTVMDALRKQGFVDERTINLSVSHGWMKDSTEWKGVWLGNNDVFTKNEGRTDIITEFDQEEIGKWVEGLEKKRLDHRWVGVNGIGDEVGGGPG
jgi:hypothetical protein